MLQRQSTVLPYRNPWSEESTRTAAFGSGHHGFPEIPLCATGTLIGFAVEADPAEGGREVAARWGALLVVVGDWDAMQG